MRNPIGIGTLLSFGLVSSAHGWPYWKRPEECSTHGSQLENRMIGCIGLGTDRSEDLAITLIIAALIITFIIFQFRNRTSRINFQFDYDETKLVY